MGREERAAEIFVKVLELGGLSPEPSLRAQVTMSFWQFSLFAESPIDQWQNVALLRHQWEQTLKTASGLVSKAIEDADLEVRADMDFDRAEAELHERIARYEIARDVLNEIAAEHGQIALGLGKRIASLKGRTSDKPEIRGRNALIRRLFAIYCEWAKVHPRSVVIGIGKSNRDRLFVDALQDSFTAFFRTEPGKPEVSHISEILKKP